MSRLETVIVSYAEYHRDTRNIRYHSFGIPTIVFAVFVLLSRGGPRFGDVTLTPALALTLATVTYYATLDVGLASAMLAASALMLWGADRVARRSTAAWLGVGIGAFTFGWALQFRGHACEGRKPAFLDDLKSLAIGPLFVMTELCYALGGLRDLEHVVEREAGPLRTPLGGTA